MKRGKGKAFAIVTGIIAIAVVAIALVVARDRIIEAWYFSKLRSPDPKERGEAIEKLKRIGSVRALPILLERLTSRENMIDPENPRGHPVFESYIALKAIEEIAAARRSLAAPALREGLRVKSASLNDALAGMLADIGPGAIPSLSAGLRDPDPAFRARVTIVIGRIAAKSPADVPVLLEALADPEKPVRWQAAKALEALGPRARFAVPALARALGDPDMEIRYLTAKVLGQVGPPARPAAPALERALGDPVEDVRDAAAASFKKIRG